MSVGQPVDRVLTLAEVAGRKPAWRNDALQGQLRNRSAARLFNQHESHSARCVHTRDCVSRLLGLRQRSSCGYECVTEPPRGIAKFGGADVYNIGQSVGVVAGTVDEVRIGTAHSLSRCFGRLTHAHVRQWNSGF